MRSWTELIRPLNCLMAGGAVLAGSFLVTKSVTFPALIAIAAAFLITGAGNAINDFFDVESDRINRPKRPIASGSLSRRSAILFTLALFGTGIVLAASINWLCFLIATVNSILLVVYSFNLQNKVLVGNMAVSYLVGSSFLFGGAAAGNIVLPLILMLLASLATFAREVVKDLEDIEGDRKAFIKRISKKMKDTFADRFRVSPWGIKLRYKTVYAVLIASFSLWMAALISSLPYVWGILGFSYLVLLVPTDALLILASLVVIRRRNYALSSRLIKIGMLVGLLAFFSGVLF